MSVSQRYNKTLLCVHKRFASTCRPPSYQHIDRMHFALHRRPDAEGQPLKDYSSQWR